MTSPDSNRLRSPGVAESLVLMRVQSIHNPHPQLSVPAIRHLEMRRLVQRRAADTDPMHDPPRAVCSTGTSGGPSSFMQRERVAEQRKRSLCCRGSAADFPSSRPKRIAISRTEMRSGPVTFMPGCWRLRRATGFEARAEFASPCQIALSQPTVRSTSSPMLDAPRDIDQCAVAQVDGVIQPEKSAAVPR